MGVRDIVKKYPDRVPVHVTGPDGELQNKYLIPRTMKVSEFMVVLRKRIEVKSFQAIFIFVKNILPPNTCTFDDLYREHKDDDGMLYMTWSRESTFGA